MTSLFQSGLTSARVISEEASPSNQIHHQSECCDGWSFYSNPATASVISEAACPFQSNQPIIQNDSKTDLGKCVVLLQTSVGIPMQRGPQLKSETFSCPCVLSIRADDPSVLYARVSRYGSGADHLPILIQKSM